jgi:hypothetical protein
LLPVPATALVSGLSTMIVTSHAIFAYCTVVIVLPAVLSSPCNAPCSSPSQYGSR